ncbi:MAG: hypothetical protein ACLQAT_06635 [Candidatus Binataceae bacterium]
MRKSISRGSLLATAVGALFLSGTALAQNSSNPTTPPPPDQQGKVKCVGLNSCNGSSACKSATSPGPGQNSCAGKGFTLTATEKECKDKGGTPQS